MQATASGNSNWRGVLATTIGNVLEWYDFLVFGFLSLIIAKQYFPTDNEYASLMLTTATFGAGFIVRPLGGILIGMYADRHGRKAGLSLVISMMTVAAAMIAFTPSFQTIGVVAPAIVLCARLLQGLSAGGEFGTATAMLIEYAPKGRSHFYGSWQNFAQALGVLFAIGMGSALTHLFTPEALESWAWRIPFMFGLLIGPVGFYVRSKMPETEAFLNREKHAPLSLGQIVSCYRRELLIALLLSASGNVMTYALISYLPIYAVKNLHMPATLPFDVLLATVLLRTVTLPMFGHLADRIGGARLFASALVLFLIALYPCFHWMVSAPSMLSIMTSELIFGLLISAASAPAPTILAELFPTEVRSSGLSISYNIAASVFGGFSPFLLTWLLHATADNMVPAHYCAVFFVFGLVGLAWHRSEQKTKVPALA